MKLDLEQGVWFGAPIPLALEFFDQSDQLASVLKPDPASITVTATVGGGEQNLAHGTAKAQPAQAGQWPVSGVRFLEDAGRKVAASSPFNGVLNCNATLLYRDARDKDLSIYLEGMVRFSVSCGVPHRIAIQGLEALQSSLKTGQELSRDFTIEQFKVTVFDKWDNVFVGSSHMQLQLSFANVNP